MYYNVLKCSVLTRNFPEFTVRWDSEGTVYLDVTSSMQSALCGMCGDFDQNSENDMESRLGATLTDASEFAQSWQIDVSEQNIPLFLDFRKFSC